MTNTKPESLDTSELDVGPIVSLDEMAGAVESMRDALSAVADGPIDTGMGIGGADLWVTLGSVEYYVHIKAKRRKVTQ